MTRFGLTLSSEEHGPRHLVEVARAAEEEGFDFVSISDHFHPWISEQGHSPFVWSVLGALAEATEEIVVAVGVTCPIMRIHPAILAQATATTAELLEGRFVWGVGTGEALNEHILGEDWPPADIRLEMLQEAVELVRRLWSGESVTHRGPHFTVEDARVFDLPEESPPILVSAFGDQSARLAASIGDGLWTTGTGEEIVDTYRSAGGEGSVWSQLSLCWDPDEPTALERAHRVWPNTGLPGQLAQDLRTVEHMEQAATLVDPGMLRDSLPIGPDSEPILESVAAARASGIDHVYFHQIGDPLAGFIDLWKSELRPELV